MYLSISPSAYRSFNLSSIYLCFYSTHPLIHQCIFLFYTYIHLFYLSFIYIYYYYYPSVHSSINPSIRLSTFLSIIHPSVYLSFYPSIYLHFVCPTRFKLGLNKRHNLSTFHNTLSRQHAMLVLMNYSSFVLLLQRIWQ